MSDYDKKYELYKYLQSVKWDELPATYSEFNQKLNDRAYFDKAYTITSSLGQVEEGKLTKDEFYNYFNDTSNYSSNIKYYSDEQPEKQEEKSWFSRFVGDVFNLTSQIGVLATPETTPKQKEDAAKDINEYGFNILTMVRSAPEWSRPIGEISAVTPDPIYGMPALLPGKEQEEQIEKLDEVYKPGGQLDKAILEGTKNYAELRKRIRKDWYEAGILKETPTGAGQLAGQIGFTTGIMGLSFIPYIGPALGFTAGVTTEAMELAADVYEGTNGDLEATKKAYGIGSLLGATEIFGPLEAVNFAKRGVKNLLIKDIKAGVMDELKKNTLRVFGREIGKVGITESTQEMFQTWGEQMVQMDVGMQQKLNWNDIFYAGASGGFLGMLMGGGAAVTAARDIELVNEAINKTIPERLDLYLKHGLITEEEKTKALEGYEGYKNVDELKQRLQTEVGKLDDIYRGQVKEGLQNMLFVRNLTKVFDAPTSPESITKALEVAGAAEVKLNDLDKFLIQQMQAAGIQMPEFEDLKVMNEYTETVLAGIESTKEFQKIRADIKEKTGYELQTLTDYTHASLINNPEYKQYRNGYFNLLAMNIGKLRFLQEMESADKEYYSGSSQYEMRPVYRMNDEEKRTAIKAKNNSLPYVDYKNRKRFDALVNSYNESMSAQGRPERIRASIVKQGERYVYKIDEFEVRTKKNEQYDVFDMAGQKKPFFSISKAEEQKSFRKMPIEFVDVISTDREDRVAASFRDGKILVDKAEIIRKFENKEWTKPKVKGVSPFVKNMFDTVEEWFTFVMLHEYHHSQTPRGANETQAQFENRINQLAIKELRANYTVETKVDDLSSRIVPAESLPSIISLPFNMETPTTTAGGEIRRLNATNISDPSIKIAVDWLAKEHGNVELKFGRVYNRQGEEVVAEFDSGYRTVGGKRIKIKEKSITINIWHNDIRTPEDYYRAIAHELVHNATFEILPKDNVFRKQLVDLYRNIKAQILGTDFYEENKADFDRIFDAGGKQLDEFLGYVISNTSVLREWMDNNNFKPGTSWLKRFYRSILDAIWKKIGVEPKNITYLQAFEVLINQYINIPATTISDLELASPFTNQYGQELFNAGDVYDKALALEDEALGDIRAMGSFVSALGLDAVTQDPYAYIQGLSKKEFYTLVNKAKNLDAKMQIYYDLKFKDTMTYEKYKKKAATYVYNNIRSSKRRRIGVLNIASNGVPTIAFYDRSYRTRKGDLIPPYHSLTMMDEVLPELNALFGTTFELVYLEDMVDERGFDTVSGKPHKIAFELDNKDLKEQFAKAGVIFPGTFADKDTLIGLIEVDSNGKQIIRDYNTEDISSKIRTIINTYRVNMEGLLKAGKVDQEYLGLKQTSMADIMRLILEDFRMGAQVVNGELISALFNPEYADTYDAIKMFKRPYLVAPKYIAAQDAKEVQDIVNEVVKEVYGGQIDKSGLVVRNGKLYFRSFIFDDEKMFKDENGNRKPFMVTINGKEYDLSKILIDDYGKPTTDGGLLYGLGGADVVYREIVGAIKTGALKFWGGNNLKGEFNLPFFLKTAAHGYAQEDNIIQWARDNNIAFIIPLSAVKVNRYGVGTLLSDDQSNVIEIPMENLYRLQEKDEAGDLARGMQQTITANFMTYANQAFAKADEKKEFWSLVKNFANNILNRFTDHTTMIDKLGMLEYVKEIISNPTNEYHRGLSQMLSNLLLTYADQRTEELAYAAKGELTPDIAMYKDMLREIQRDVRLNNAALAEKVSGLFFHTYFTKLFEDYMHKIVKELLFYDIPGTYSIYTPDIGWLAQTRVALARETALGSIKEEMDKEISKIYYEQVLPTEKELALKQDELRALEERVAKIEKDEVKQKEARQRAIEKKNKDKAEQLKEVIDDTVQELDTVMELIDTKEEQIKVLEKELKPLYKQVEGFIEEGKVNIDGRNTQVKERTDKLLYTWINEESGRIQGDYIYITEDIAKEHNAKLLDTAITGVIPSDSAQSISGASVIAIMGRKISETNKVVGWAELFQTIRGKDFDFDAVLLIFYNKLYGTRIEFQKLADIFTRTKDGYQQYILRTMRTVLREPNLSIKDIYNKEVRVRYMQAVGDPSTSKQIFNPLYDQDILDKYSKKIGLTVNKRKIATFKSMVNFRTRFSIWGIEFIIDHNGRSPADIARTHIFHLIETNAYVDIPTDDTALKYMLSQIKEFDLENGTNMEEAVRTAGLPEEVTTYYFEKVIKALKDVDMYLFGYGIKLSTVNNLDTYGEERTLQDTISYIQHQKERNAKLATREGRIELANEAVSRYVEKQMRGGKEPNPKLIAAVSKAIRNYIENIQIDNMEDSIPMYLAENVDLSTLPYIKLEKSEYMRAEQETAMKLRSVMPDVDALFNKIWNDYNEYIAYEIEHNRIEYMDSGIQKALFLMTIDNEPLHILKGKILRIVNMFIRGDKLLVPQAVERDKKIYKLTRFDKDLSVPVDDEIFYDIFNKLLEKDAIMMARPSGDYVPPASVTLNADNKTMIVKPEGRQLRFDLKTGKDVISMTSKEYKALLREGNSTAKVFEVFFSKAFGKKQGFNRGSIAQLVDFSNSLDLMDRWDLVEKIVLPEYIGLSDTDKRTLLYSLLSYSDKANDSIYVVPRRGGSPSIDRFFTMLSLLKDDLVVQQFMTDYGQAFASSIPDANFIKAHDTIKALEKSDADWEVWNMQSPKKRNLQKNLRDFVIEEKNKPYNDPTVGVTKIVNLANGTVADLTIKDVGIITEPYMPTVTTPKGDIEILSATMVKHMETVADIDSYYKETDIEISALEELYFSYGNQKILNFTKPQEQKVLREAIADLVADNPDNITVTKTAAGKYIYQWNSQQYSTADDLLNAMGKTDMKERIKYQIALKWHILYSVENPLYIRSVLAYLRSMVFEFGNNSYATQAIVSMIKRYAGFQRSIDQRLFHYYPKVYKQHVFETKIMNWLKVQEALRIEQEINDAVTYVNSSRRGQTIPNAIRNLASHLGDNAWILRTAKERIEKERFNIGVGTFGKYINSFSLKRELPDEINGVKYWIRDSFIPHQRHQTQMLKMFKNDLLFTSWLHFQHKALTNGVNKEIIENVKTEVATISGNRLLMSRDIDTGEITPGMEVSFYYINDKYYSGVVDKVDRGYVYLKMDKARFERYLKEELDKYEQTHLSIIMNPALNSRPATMRQQAVIGDLTNQGYITMQQAMAVQTIPDASQLIIEGLRRQLNDINNWGRFRKADLFRKNASAIGPATGENGAYRYIEFGALEHLRGMARELDNTFDGKLSQEGFGDIVSSKLLIPYLKYEALMFPGRFLDLGAKTIALIGLSTPAAMVKNTLDGMAGIIRDRGFIPLVMSAKPVVQISRGVKSAFEEGKVAPDNSILATSLVGNVPHFINSKRDVAIEIAKRFMLERGLIFEDYLINSVAGNIEELFIEDERNRVEYKAIEKAFNIYKSIQDAWGYKEHRDKIIELEKKLYDSIDPIESQRLMQEIDTENQRWDTLYAERMRKAAELATKLSGHQANQTLMKVNLAEIHNKSTAELIGTMASVIKDSRLIGYLLGTKGFKRAEGHIRRMTAINYIYDALLRGETDIELIKQQAGKGIARTQALYDIMNRRLGDRTKLGRFALMFGQYPYFIKQVFKGTIKQAKAEDRADLKRKLVFEWYRDTVMSGFNFFFQGLRMGSPINVTINLVLMLALNALKRWDEDKEPFDFSDWDTRDAIFALLQFKIGMGIGLMLGTAYNAVTEQDKLISIGRIGRAFDILASLLFPPSEEQPKWKDKYATEEWIKQLSRYSIGINPLFPGYSNKFTDKDLLEHYKKTPPNKLLDYWEPFIPLFPHIKYGTDF